MNPAGGCHETASQSLQVQISVWTISKFQIPTHHGDGDGDNYDHHHVIIENQSSLMTIAQTVMMMTRMR